MDNSENTPKQDNIFIIMASSLALLGLLGAIGLLISLYFTGTLPKLADVLLAIFVMACVFGMYAGVVALHRLRQGD
jgi:hypothetical protein